MTPVDILDLSHIPNSIAIAGIGVLCHADGKFLGVD